MYLKMSRTDTVGVNKSLGKRLAHLVGNTVDSDFTFHILEDDKFIPAHKIIVESGSAVLHDIIYGKSGLTGSIGSSTTVDAISSSSFMEILRYLYTDDADINPENAIEILHKVHYYGIVELERRCVDVLIRALKSETVWVIFQQLFSYYSYREVVRKCLNFIMYCPKLAFSNESFLDVDIECFKHILRLPAINIDELALYQLLLRWAVNACGVRKMEVTAGNIRAVMDGAEKLVKFSSLSLQEFELCLKYHEDVLSPNEIADIREKINKSQHEERRKFLTCQDTTWKPHVVGQPMHPSAVYGGEGCDVSAIFVGRSLYDGEYRLVEIVPSTRSAYLNFKGGRISVNEYEVLCGSGFEWVSVDNEHDLRLGAVATSIEVVSPIYIGRDMENRGFLECRINDYRNYVTDLEHREYNPLIDFEYLKGCNAKPPLPPGFIPNDAVVGGSSTDGSPMYVCRVYHDGYMLPARYMPSEGRAYLGYGDREHFIGDYELLRHSNTDWVAVSKADSPENFPDNAIVGGWRNCNEAVYVGRVQHPDLNGPYILGRVLRLAVGNLLVIAFNGREVEFYDYEVLVAKPADENLESR